MTDRRNIEEITQKLTLACILSEGNINGKGFIDAEIEGSLIDLCFALLDIAPDTQLRVNLINANPARDDIRGYINPDAHKHLLVVARLILHHGRSKLLSPPLQFNRDALK